MSPTDANTTDANTTDANTTDANTTDATATGQAKTDDASPRRCLLEATGRLLAKEGPAGLSLRKIAEACEVSTQMIYTLFGGKSGLLEALWEHAFEGLAAQLETVPEDLPPMQRVGELGRAYRRFAVEHPALYDAMFARPVLEFRPPSADRTRETDAFQYLREAVVDCAQAGLFDAEAVDEVADVLWAAVHGSVGLESAGYFAEVAEAEARFELMLQSIFPGLVQQRSSPQETP